MRAIRGVSAVASSTQFLNSRGASVIVVCDGWGWPVVLSGQGRRWGAFVRRCLRDDGLWDGRASVYFVPASAVEALGVGDVSAFRLALLNSARLVDAAPGGFWWRALGLYLASAVRAAEDERVADSA